MSFTKFVPAVTWLIVLVNAIATATFFYFFYLFVFDTSIPENEERTWLDNTFPYLFVIGGIYFLLQTRRAVKLARNYKPIDEYSSLSHLSKKKSATQVLKTHQPTTETDAHIRDMMAKLVRHNVITQVEYKQSDFDAALRIDEWENDYASLCSILIFLHEDNRERFSNLYCRVEQVEIFEKDYVHLIGKLAQMLRLNEHPQNARIEYGDRISTLSFDWAGVSHQFKGNFPSKYLAWDVVPDIARLLETQACGRRICCSATDMCFILTALTAEALASLNDDFRDDGIEDFEHFQYLT